MAIHRPDTSGYSGPEHEHDRLSEREAERKLQKPIERVHNLGHPTTHDKLHEHPLKGKIHDYTSDDVGEMHIREGQRPGRGVYGKTSDPRSGLSTESNIDEWSRRASTNSYHGKDPTGRGAGSDGHLASTENWASFEYGSESGPGRIEKSHKK